VGTIIAWIGEPGETIPNRLEGDSRQTELQINHGEEQKVKESRPGLAEPDQDFHGSHLKIGRSPEFGFISPIVAKITAENDVDISKVTSTGLGGRITKRDVMTYLETSEKKSPTSSKLNAGTGTPSRTIPHTSIRRKIADHMVMSKRTSPHVTTLMEADLSRIAVHRKANKDIFAKREIRLTSTLIGYRKECQYTCRKCPIKEIIPKRCTRGNLQHHKPRSKRIITGNPDHKPTSMCHIRSRGNPKTSCCFNR